jgi:hypothetical protein
MRKWCAWYTKGFRGSSAVRAALVRVRTIEAMLAAVQALDATEPFPLHALRAVRGKSGAQAKVALPHGWLEDRDGVTPPDESALGPDVADYEATLSGG